MDVLRRVILPFYKNVSHLLCEASKPSARNFSILSVNTFQPSISSLSIRQSLLAPTIPLVIPSCGFKVVGKVKKRCRGCYMVMREQRLYNLCKLKPRHKQMSMKADEDKSWILSGVSQGPKRPW
jgi:large subunit ribosomal protein L36